MQTTLPHPVPHLRAPAPDTAERRRRRRIRAALLATGGLALVAALGSYAWLRATSDVQRTGTSCELVTVRGGDPFTASDTRDGICRTMSGLMSTWAQGDAAAYGAHFTDDATYAAFTGTVYEGRDDIVRGHAALFGRFLAGTRLEQSYLDVRLVSSDVALVLTRGDTYDGDDPARDGPPTKVQSYTLVREPDGVWRVAAFHNTQRSPLMERVQFLVEPDSRPAAER